VDLHLRNGSRILIVGGGPAGSFFALAVLRFAREAGLDLHVTIYEPRDFAQPGPKGCNMCAGIIPGFVLQEMRALGLDVPPGVVQSPIDSYVLHVAAGTLHAAAPDRGAHAVSVYRGNGPRHSGYTSSVSFDGFLLREAEKRGAYVVRERVEEVCLTPQRWVRSSTGRNGCDLVVLATGVNASGLTIRGGNYAAPSARAMAQTEIFLGEEEVRRRLGSSIHVFLPRAAGLAFGTLVPKGAFANLSLLGKDLGPRSVGQFLRLPEVAAVLPPGPQRVCACHPRIAVSAGRAFWGDGFVAVGDSAVTRLYKNGIGTALVMALQAARTAVHMGISRQDFTRGYGPLCRRIARDNLFGRLLFAVTGLLRRDGPFARAYLDTIAREQERPVVQRTLSRILWGMFTGSDSYRGLTGMLFRPEVGYPLCSRLLLRVVGRQAL
jgi:flavin-dependent dehydrogenase